MHKESSFNADVTLRDGISYEKLWTMEGNATKVLMEAIRFIEEKDKKSMHKNIILYILDDFKTFDDMMNKLFFKKND